MINDKESLLVVRWVVRGIGVISSRTVLFLSRRVKTYPLDCVSVEVFGFGM